MAKYIMALDAGKTSNRCILFNRSGEMCSVAQKEFTQYFPKPGWVEHDADEIWSTILEVARQALANVGANASDIASIGIPTSVKQQLYGTDILVSLYTMLLYGSAEGLQNTQILLKRKGLQKQSVTKPVLLLMRIFLEPS